MPDTTTDDEIEFCCNRSEYRYPIDLFQLFRCKWDNTVILRKHGYRENNTMILKLIQGNIYINNEHVPIGNTVCVERRDILDKVFDII